MLPGLEDLVQCVRVEGPHVRIKGQLPRLEALDRRICVER